MFEYEKHLEDYICNNQDQFIEKLKDIYGEDFKIEFIGRQINIGRENIADLMYYIKDTDVDLDNNIFDTETYIIVELKNRELAPKDLAQLFRYKNTLLTKLLKENQKIKEKKEISVEGIFVAPSISKELKEMLIDREHEFYYITFSMKLDFNIEDPDYSYKDEYIENLELDERIININK